MAQVTTYFNGINVYAGPAMILTRSRDAALTQVSALTTPNPTSTTFTVSTADGAKLNLGDLCCLATVTPNSFLVAEAGTLSMITAMVAGTAGSNLTVSPAIGTPPTTASGVTRVWTNRGATTGGIEWSTAPAINLLYVDQSLPPVSAVDKEKVIMFKAPLAEATLTNYALVAGMKDPASGLVLQYNSTDASATTAFLLIQKAQNGKNRYTIAHKCKVNGAAVHKSDKTNPPIYALQAMVLVDSTMVPDTFDAGDI